MDLFIDSSDRSSGGLDNANYIITKPVEGQYAALVGAWFYLTAYPVAAHSVIFYEDGSTASEFTASISAGNYTSSTYIAALQTAMNAAVGITHTYTVTFNSTSAKITITANAGTVALSSSNTTASQRYTGFTSQSFALAITGDRPANLSAPLFVDVRIGGAQSGVGVQGLAMVARIPLNASFGGLVTFSNEQLPTYFPTESLGSSFNVAFIDQNGAVFTNQSSYLLKFHFISGRSV